ncbi:MAG TPA: hypothetical protein PJ982_06490 [Lacipirellulaceae bacterium]|nr:hypothetical protein [Lacipirellulaceae bacterium]
MPHSLRAASRSPGSTWRRAWPLALAALAGCQAAFTAPPDAALDRLLRPASSSPSTVTLEIFEARIPLDEDAQAESLWQEIDEQCFDAPLRRRLLANGLRAGVASGAPPQELSRLLGLASEMPEESPDRPISPDLPVPRVTRRVVQINARGQRTLQTADSRDEATVLISDEGRLRGRTYQQVEGRYELRASTVPGQRISVRLVPELHHGELRNRYSGSDQGALLIVSSREREAFERLALQAELGPGDLLVVGCLPQAESSLGAMLHTAAIKGRRERKLLLIRLLGAAGSEILAGK